MRKKMKNQLGRKMALNFVLYRDKKSIKCQRSFMSKQTENMY